MNTVSWKTTLWGMTVIVAALAFLFFLPKFTQRKQFMLPGAGNSSDQPRTFPIDRSFARVQFEKDKPAKLGPETTVNELLEASGRKSVLVNFWATWCPPCIEELPSLEHFNRLVTKSKDEPLVVTISVDARVEDLTSLARTLDFSPSFIVLFDKEGEFSTQVGTTRFPETYWVGRDGLLFHKWLGPQDWLSEGVLKHLASRK